MVHPGAQVAGQYYLLVQAGLRTLLPRLHKEYWDADASLCLYEGAVALVTLLELVAPGMDASVEDPALIFGQVLRAHLIANQRESEKLMGRAVRQEIWRRIDDTTPCDLSRVLIR